MKTKFEDFVNEFKESFNADEAVKDMLKKAFGKEKYSEKEILDKIYKLLNNLSLPLAVDKITKEYPALKSFKKELIAALDSFEDEDDNKSGKGKKGKYEED